MFSTQFPVWRLRSRSWRSEHCRLKSVLKGLKLYFRALSVIHLLQPPWLPLISHVLQLPLVFRQSTLEFLGPTPLTTIPEQRCHPGVGVYINWQILVILRNTGKGSVHIIVSGNSPDHI